MDFQRYSRHSGIILLVLALIIAAAVIEYPRVRPNQDTFSGVRVAIPPQPNWRELTPAQREILAPLAADWNEMERFRRKKWLEIAARYPNLSEAEQARLRDRMQDWANMTPAQRQAARERFKELSLQTSAEEREALAQKWMDYQNLPEDVRAQLEQEARDKEKADKHAARTPVIDGKATPTTTKDGSLPSGTLVETLVAAPGAVKVVPPKAAVSSSPLTFAPNKPTEDPPALPQGDTGNNESR